MITTIRHKFYLVVLIGAILPLAGLAAWLTFSVERAGIDVLQTQLDTACKAVADQAEDRWFSLRGDLLLLANNEVVTSEIARPGAPLPKYEQNIFDAANPALRRVAIYDKTGKVRWRLTRDVTMSANRIDPATAHLAPSRFVTVSYPIRDTAKHTLGRVTADFIPNALLPDTAPAMLGSGNVNVIDKAGTPLLSSTFPDTLLHMRSGTFDGTLWVVARRSITDIPLTLVLVARGESYIEPFRAAARAGLLTLLGIAAAVILLTFGLTNRLTHSLGALARASERIRNGDLTTRLEAQNNDEVGRVAMTFNEMARSLEATLAEIARKESLAAVGQYAAETSHEVRNGLTSIRADLQRAQEDNLGGSAANLVDRALRNITRLDNVITGSLRVARTGAVPMEMIALRDTLASAADIARHEFVSRGRRLVLDYDGMESVTLRGNAQALQHLWVNLLLNAAQANGDATVELSGDAEIAIVTISDNGDGFDKTLSSAVPFHSTKADGTGLGLAIAKKIVSAHGGAITIGPGARGTVVSVQLPIPHHAAVAR
jgi:signal transduction histidine kinase